MKHLFFTLAVVGLVFTSCSEDNSDQDMIGETPQAVYELTSTYYPGVEYIVDEDIDEDGEISYDVDMANGVDMEFDAQGNLVEIDADDQLVPTELIPSEILTYVESNFPNAGITAWELDEDDNVQSVELTLDIELIFDLDGNFIMIDA